MSWKEKSVLKEGCRGGSLLPPRSSPGGMTRLAGDAWGLSKVYFRGRVIVEGGVSALVVVFSKVIFEPSVELLERLIFPAIDFFILHGAPQSFDKNVIQTA